MPIFDYKCEDCDHMMENKIRKAEVLNIPCEECDGISHKQVSAPGHIEGGFYNAEEKAGINDYIRRLEEKTGISQGGN